MPIHNRKYLKLTRKKLRNTSTPAESFLWKYLRRSQLDKRKFRRQHSIENYIVDFYCPSEKLIIELDGEGHFESVQNQKDLDRDSRLTELGFRVLRFENQFVFDHLPNVLNTIKSEFQGYSNFLFY